MKTFLQKSEEEIKMEFFNLLGYLLDSAEETMKDTAKNVIEKTPGLVSSVSKLALDVARQGMIEAGKKINKFQSEEFKQRQEKKNCENQETVM